MSGLGRYLFYGEKLKTQFAYYSNEIYCQRNPNPGIKHAINMQPLRQPQMPKSLSGRTPFVQASDKEFTV